MLRRCSHLCCPHVSDHELLLLLHLLYHGPDMTVLLVNLGLKDSTAQHSAAQHSTPQSVTQVQHATGQPLDGCMKRLHPTSQARNSWCSIAAVQATSTAQHCTAPHPTEHHSTAQRNIVQRSTA
jgi:hypothetical protein